MPDQTCSQEEWEYVMWMYSAQAEGAIRQFMSPAFRILSSAITSAVAPTDWGECLRVLVVPGLPVSDLEVSAECLRDAVREEGIVVRTVYDSSEDTSSPHSFDLSSPSLDPEIPTCLVTSATTADECCKFEKLLAYISMLNPIPRNSGMRRLCVVVVCSEMSVYLNTVLSGDERRNFYPVVHHVEDTSDQLADTLLFELLHPVLPIAPGLCAMSILTEVVRGGETLAIHKALCSLLRHHPHPLPPRGLSSGGQARPLGPSHAALRPGPRQLPLPFRILPRGVRTPRHVGVPGYEEDLPCLPPLCVGSGEADQRDQ
eukprot:Sspe_Gene.65938::Locus_38981_Transcript_1_1_Confidence_1.000_Length_1267::g.65938::m.65938